VLNTAATTVSVDVEFLRKDGTTLNQQTVSIAPHAQIHFQASQYLSAGETGFVSIVPNETNSIVSQSMFYFRGAATGNIEAMYGSQSREALGQSMIGSYNLFLGMENWLRVANTADQSVTIKLTINAATVSSEHTFQIPALGAINLPLHSTAQFQTAADSYGVVTVSTTGSGNIFSELLRIRTTGDATDFAVPTVVR